MRNRLDKQIDEKFRQRSTGCTEFNIRLASYLAATGAAGSLLAGEGLAAVVSNTTVQPFGIDGEVNIDFNLDGQIDFQIDHDRLDLNGTDLDYLQIDKNDFNSAENPIPIDGFNVFTVPDGQGRNYDHQYLATDGDISSYPLALTDGTSIGPDSLGWVFQETDNLQGVTVRSNRLIDEDASQFDTNAGAPAIPPGGTPGWVGLGGETRYLGVRIDLQDQGFSGNAFPGSNGAEDIDDPANYWYGWIGVRITNEADATGEVVGYAYETELGTAILAGDVGTSIGLPGDYNGDSTVDAADYTIWRDNLGLMGGATASQGDGNNDGNVTTEDYNIWKTNFGQSNMGFGAATPTSAVPEPSSILIAIVTGLMFIGTFMCRRIWRA
jgi:hypothetical protein